VILACTTNHPENIGQTQVFTVRQHLYIAAMLNPKNWNPLHTVRTTFHLLLLAYLAASILLSLLVFFRLQIAPLDAVKGANITLYFSVGYVLPLASFLWATIFLLWLYDPKGTLKTVSFFVLFLAAAISYVFLLLLALTGEVPAGPLIQIAPVASAALLYVAKLKPRRRTVAVLAVVLSVSLLLPYFSVFACQSSIIAQAKSIPGEADRASFIAGYVSKTAIYETPLFLGPFSGALRASDDLWKFLLGGRSACRELAEATSNLLNQAGLENRRVSLPGEDHTFIEVRIDGEWRTLDPGYYGGELLTRQNRTERRIAEFGAISYIIAYRGSSLVELTQYYVPTDTIVIRVTSEGEPIVNAKVYLTHKFMGRTLRLPDSNVNFYTDGNGTVTLHMGALTYGDRAAEFESLYHVYVDGQDTGYTVTSTGTGVVQRAEIDLAG